MLAPDVLLTVNLQEQLFADPRRIALLRQIHQSGSISQAAKQVGVSYKTAWDNIDAMTKLSPQPLLERSAGGKQGGGTTLTAYAQRLLRLYDLLTELQVKAFTLLHDESVPIDSLLVAAARSSLQSSARNQFFGRVQHLSEQNHSMFVSVQIDGLLSPLLVAVTPASSERLRLDIGREVMTLIKAPWLKFCENSTACHNVFQGIVQSVSTSEVEILVDEVVFCATYSAQSLALAVGQAVQFVIDPKQIMLATLY